MNHLSRESLARVVEFVDADPDTEEEIAYVERTLGFIFPPTYRAILTISAEGHMGPIATPTDSELHFNFHPMRRERFEFASSRILDVHKRILRSKSDMRAVIPFGAVGNGDMVCFDYRFGADPKIVLWKHEVAFTRDDSLVPVADSFDDLIRKAENKKGEPGATDNPDDAQRLREDH
jgi:hypothetical protein